MFFAPLSSRQNHPQGPAYLRKKNIYQEQIRKKDRQKLMSLLRKNAQLPEDLGRLAYKFPESAHELIAKISRQQIVEWEESIAYVILTKLRDRVREMFESNDFTCMQSIYFFVFLLRKGNEEVSLYNEFYDFIRKKSNLWTYPEKIELFGIFNMMLKRGHSYVLKDAEEFLSKMHSNRFFDRQLRFYDNILRKFPTQQNIQTFLSRQTLRRLSQQIGIHFYTEEEKIAMMEILIQVLYLSSQTYISRSFEIQTLFNNLEYYFGFCNGNKLLIDRCILLIYNINIDATSEKFIKHSCSKAVTCEMKNKDHPPKIRSLMAELYLNSIFHYPAQSFIYYLKSNIVSIFCNFQYIIDEFVYDNDAKEMALELFRKILTQTAQELSHQQYANVFNYMKSNSSFLKTLRGIKQFEAILEQYHIEVDHL